ncbi:MAG: transcriptional regulator, partial [Hyphomonas sp.]
IPGPSREQLRAAIGPSTRSKFGRKAHREGDIGYVNDWGLLVHASKEDLLADVPRITREPGKC